MKWLEKILSKPAIKSPTKKANTPKSAPKLFSGRPVPKPNKTEPFRKGIF